EIYENDLLVALSAEERFVSLGLLPGTTYLFKVRARGSDGRVSAFTDALSVSTDPALPVISAPPFGTGIPAFATATDFLVTGPGAVQRDVAPDALIRERRAVLRGSVRYRDGVPITAVEVAILGQPELGHTVTRADGQFDLAVNGGGPVTVTFAKAGLLAAQRTIEVGWQEYVDVPGVVLVPLDEQVTTVSPEASSEIEVARGSVISDAEGTRRATLFFQPGTEASMIVN